jgi:hypothetical protein
MKNKNVRIYLCLGLFALLFGAASEQANAQAKNDVFGYYTIEGKVPAAFSDISEIHLAGSYGAKQKTPMYGLIRLKSKSGKDFHINKPVINGKNISISTDTVDGISYKFNGTFLKFPNNQATEGTVLRGTLQKFKGKSQVASANLKFTYSPGD